MFWLLLPLSLCAYCPLNLRALHPFLIRKFSRQYKNLKYLARISVVDSLKDIGDGTGSAAPGIGYSWYAGI